MTASDCKGKRSRSTSADDGGKQAQASKAEQEESPRKKRARTQREGDIASPPYVGLLHLPTELLYTIHLYAKNPAFVLLNRHLHAIFHACPTSIKVRYLLARWHEAYCYGYLPPTAASSTKRRTDLPDQPALPSAPSWDLLEGGALPELTWSSRFIPVLPANEFPYPLSNSFQRSADHFVLDYCLRYPLTTLKVLQATEEHVLRSEEFGNIVAATGLWRDVDGNLHAHEPRHAASARASAEEDEVHATRPCHLRVTELPKRLFQSLRGASSQGDAEAGAPEGRGREAVLAVVDPRLARHLVSFGPGPLPSSSSLLILLAVGAVHVPTTTAMPAASAPFNSYEGLPLAKATFAQSLFMVQLLLALGAEPARKASLSLYIAIRSGWLAGLQLLVERDEAKIVEWQAALASIRSYFAAQEKGENACQAPGTSTEPQGEDERQVVQEDVISSPGRLPAPVSLAPAPIKRRRLLDRVPLDHKMLKEAVKHNRWPMANWLRSKGVIPDLRTIKLIEMKQGSQEALP